MGFFSDFVEALTKPEVLITAAVTTLVFGPIAGMSTIQTFAVYASAQAAMVALAPTPELPDFSNFTSQAGSRTQMVKQPITNRRAVYGEIRLSGPLAHIESTDDDQYLHLIILLASHEVNSIGTIYVNDTALTLDGNGNATGPSPYADLIRVKKHLGTDDQAADATLISESGKWTSEHRLRGIAYIYVRLEFDRDAFPQGIPNISALVQGKKVYDPRTATTAYSTNPALCIRDYLLNTKYGLGALSTEVDDTTFSTAANICDESISLSGGGSESRYTFNGNIESSESPKDTVSKMLTSCGGIVFYTNGAFSMKAAKYVAPTVSLDENNLKGTLQVQTKRSVRDNYNAVKGIFTPPSTNFIATDYPPVISDTFLEEDNNFRQFLDYDLPYTTSSPTAQRLAKIALFRQRQQVAISGMFDLNAFQLAVGDTVQITNTRLGFSSKVFEVAEWRLDFDPAGNLGVFMSLRELASTVYDWNAEESAFQLDNTVLPSPFDLEGPGVSASDELQLFNEKALSVLIVDVSSGSVYADRFEVEAKKADQDTFIALGTASSNRFELVDVEDGVTYDIRARIVSGLGIRSPFTAIQHNVVGKTDPPQDVTNLSVNIIGTEAHLSWTPVTDVDLSHYVIRHSPATSGAEYANSITIQEKVSRPTNNAIVPALTGTYFVKAVDKLDLASLNPASSVAIIEEIKGFNSVATSTQNPSFAGTKSSVVAIDNELILDTSILFDSAAGNFDDGNGSFDGGGGNVAASGTYDFDSVIDVGGIFTSHVTASVTVIRRDYVNLFDDAQGNFDARTGTFDGDVQSFDDTDVELQIATTEDDPSGTPTFSAFRRFIVGDYKARGLKFRAVLTSGDGEATPVVTALSVTVDMPDRSIAEADIASGTAAKAITFSPAFKELQGVGIAAQNLASGDYYQITSKSATGFTITFYNSSNTIIDRTFDYVAKGYGEIAA